VPATLRAFIDMLRSNKDASAGKPMGKGRAKKHLPNWRSNSRQSHRGSRGNL
jgi:hypothetical protein